MRQKVMVRGNHNTDPYKHERRPSEKERALDGRWICTGKGDSLPAGTVLKAKAGPFGAIRLEQEAAGKVAHPLTHKFQQWVKAGLVERVEA